MNLSSICAEKLSYWLMITWNLSYLILHCIQILTILSDNMHVWSPSGLYLNIGLIFSCVVFQLSSLGWVFIYVPYSSFSHLQTRCNWVAIDKQWILDLHPSLGHLRSTIHLAFLKDTKYKLYSAWNEISCIIFNISKLAQEQFATAWQIFNM